MTDCDHPICHENTNRRIDRRVKFDAFNDLKECVKDKIPKKTVWRLFAILVPLIILLGGVGINVWSEQKGADDKYAQNGDMIKVQVVVEHLASAIVDLKQDIKEGQTKAQTDREEMLRLLRKR